MTVHSGVCALTLQLQKHHAGRRAVTETVTVAALNEQPADLLQANFLISPSFTRFTEDHQELHQGNKYMFIQASCH